MSTTNPDDVDEQALYHRGEGAPPRLILSSRVLTAPLVIQTHVYVDTKNQLVYISNGTGWRLTSTLDFHTALFRADVCASVLGNIPAIDRNATNILGGTDYGLAVPVTYDDTPAPAKVSAQENSPTVAQPATLLPRKKRQLDPDA
jgi:hypothetical protein